MTAALQLFSSLYSILPSAQRYLKLGGMSASAAAYTNIGCFLGGVVVIQAIARFAHRFIPTDIVGCDRSHGDGESHSNGEPREEASRISNDGFRPQRSRSLETTPLLHRIDTSMSGTTLPRPTGQASISAQGGNVSCNGEGPCYGYSNPGVEEYGRESGRRPSRPMLDGTSTTYVRPASLPRSLTAPFPEALRISTSIMNEEPERHQPGSVIRPEHSNQRWQGVLRDTQAQHNPRSMLNGNHAEQDADDCSSTRSESGASHKSAGPHHHHIPKNAFLAIGLQTSIAIALHKLPEGFITFATNHANPKLGFLIFMALFLHNITEGYALALPLYLALESRWKAILWSSLLGGISQPLGAGVAALWFQIAGKTDMAPGETVYGCMFAVTAGVMTSVALQLFSESLDLAHNGDLCVTFAFIGMGILGLSFALTAS